jgi:hypothetical protein
MLELAVQDNYQARGDDGGQQRQQPLHAVMVSGFPVGFLHAWQFAHGVSLHDYYYPQVLGGSGLL